MGSKGERKGLAERGRARVAKHVAGGSQRARACTKHDASSAAMMKRSAEHIVRLQDAASLSPQSLGSLDVGRDVAVAQRARDAAEGDADVVCVGLGRRVLWLRGGKERWGSLCWGWGGIGGADGAGVLGALC